MSCQPQSVWAERIPTEILCEIFLSVEAHYNKYSRKVDCAIFISHVCSRWRKVSLGFPDLWARMICSFSAKSTTDVILERSRGSSKLEFESVFLRSDGTSSYHLSLARRNIQRARVLLYGQEINDWSDTFDGKTLPNLEILELRRWNWPQNDGYSERYSAKAPSLLKLDLRGMLFPINAPALRTLCLDFDPDLVRKNITTAQLLSFLRCTPLLENLSLYYATTQDDATDFYKDGKVVLSHLRKVNSRNFGRDLLFWEAICAPPEIRFTLEILGFDANSGLPLLCKAIERHLRAPSVDTLRVAWPEGSDNCEIAAYPKRLSSCRYTIFSLSADLDNETDFPHMLESVTCRLQAENIREIILDGFSDPYTRSDFERMHQALVPFIAVKTLKITSKLCLHRFLQNEYGNDKNGLLLPSLRLLILYFPERNVGKLQEAWTALIEVLSERARLGQRLPKLVIRSSSLSSNGILYLDGTEEVDAIQKANDDGLRRACRLVDRVETSLVIRTRVNKKRVESDSSDAEDDEDSESEDG